MMIKLLAITWNWCSRMWLDYRSFVARLHAKIQKINSTLTLLANLLIGSVSRRPLYCFSTCIVTTLTLYLDLHWTLAILNLIHHAGYEYVVDFFMAMTTWLLRSLSSYVIFEWIWLGRRLLHGYGYMVTEIIIELCYFSMERWFFNRKMNVMSVRLLDRYHS